MFFEYVLVGLSAASLERGCGVASLCEIRGVNIGAIHEWKQERGVMTSRSVVALAAF